MSGRRELQQVGRVERSPEDPSLVFARVPGGLSVVLDSRRWMTSEKDFKPGDIVGAQRDLNERFEEACQDAHGHIGPRMQLALGRLTNVAGPGGRLEPVYPILANIRI